jgi:hypothetical protein
MGSEKNRQEIAVLKNSSNSELLQYHCHSLVGGSTAKCSKREAFMKL